MDHYLDIKILPDPEFPAPILMNALFAKLHWLLVRLDTKTIGVSFPKVDQGHPNIGELMRLHGSAQGLEQLQSQSWLKGMRDHIEMSAITPVPDKAQHCRVKRVQVKSSVERLRRRYQKRHPGVTEKDAKGIYPDAVEKRTPLPYLQLKSESTGQQFRLFLEHQAPQQQVVAGEFNSYGLSSTATIPWF